ncbi:unnamed protein product [Lampetra fluviatilis]
MLFLLPSRLHTARASAAEPPPLAPPSGDDASPSRRSHRAEESGKTAAWASPAVRAERGSLSPVPGSRPPSPWSGKSGKDEQLPTLSPSSPATPLPRKPLPSCHGHTLFCSSSAHFWVYSSPSCYSPAHFRSGTSPFTAVTRHCACAGGPETRGRRRESSAFAD